MKNMMSCKTLCTETHWCHTRVLDRSTKPNSRDIFNCHVSCLLWMLLVAHKTPFALVSNIAVVSESQFLHQRTPCTYLRDATSCERTAVFMPLGMRTSWPLNVLKNMWKQRCGFRSFWQAHQHYLSQPDLTYLSLVQLWKHFTNVLGYYVYLCEQQCILHDCQFQTHLDEICEEIPNK